MMQKSMENTVFVRFEPTPKHRVMRHELEDIFSQAGPIKKSSWINTKGATAPSGDGADYQRGIPSRSSKGYGFIKYLSKEDAIAARTDLNNSKIQMEGTTYTLKVELASASAAASSKQARAGFRTKSKDKDKGEGNDSGGGGGGNDEQKQQHQKQQQHQKHHQQQQQQQRGQSPDEQEQEQAALLKKKSRIILRNLSFYARENHIRKIMESNYGRVSDVHVPKVKNNLHVGFCFVTFEDPKDAQKAVDSQTVDIQKRAVRMDWSLPKKLHQQQKQQQRQQKQQTEERSTSDEIVADKTNDDDSSNGDSDSDSSNGDSDSDSDSDSDDSTDKNDAMEEDSDDDQEDEPMDDSVGKKCCLFLRNLPFDATRHDVFQLLYKFGHIKGIYLVRDKDTGMLKGTAFVTYSKPQGARRAMDFAASSSSSSSSTGTPFVSQRQSAARSNINHNDNGGDGDGDAIPTRGSLTLKGRTVLVDMAVDKETAATFDSKEYKIPHADRRNLYLQAEARVESSSTDPGADNTDTWDDLPQQDQRKRQTALKDKTAKLQSPIFFINPNRLSFRNMGKHVDEAGLQKLIELATKRGLEKQLVGAEDQIAHWRALGELSTREILAKVQEIEGSDRDVVPAWNYDQREENDNDHDNDNDNDNDQEGGDDETTATTKKRRKKPKSIKDYVPSVYIDRDFGPSGKKADAPSRGFGFAEFAHHAHALACLRELNNNPAYSKDYAAGGKAAAALKKQSNKHHHNNKKGKSSGFSAGDYRDEEGKVRVPRLIVDFVVENKVKAKKQAERRLQQQLNQSKQQLETLEKKKTARKQAGDDNDAPATKKRGRGAIQREKKRLKRESGEEERERQAKLQKKALYEAKKELRRERAEEKKKKAEELKRKSVKPPKKKKSQLKKIEDDEEFESIVRSYQSKLESAREENAPRANQREAVKDKRWFE